MEEVNRVLEKHCYAKENIIQIMLELQNLSGRNYLPAKWVEHVSKCLEMQLSKVYEVITFYSMFSTKPRGKYLIEVCKSGPCHVTGAKDVLHMIQNELGINVGETTSDGLFTLEVSNCFGACDIAPAIKIGENVYGCLTVESLQELVQSCREEQKYEELS